MMDFEAAARDFIAQFPSVTAASQSCDNYFLTRYYDADKRIEWTSLKAGSIYTFDYLIPSPEEKIETFIDRRPILMILPTAGSYSKNKIMGLDLVLLKPNLRASFLTKLANAVKLVYEDGKPTNMDDVREQLGKIDLNFSKRVLSDYPIDRIVKGFDIRYIPGFIEIGLDDWIKIPYLNDFKIQGTTISRIYNS